MAKEKTNPFATMSNKRKEEQDKILKNALNKTEEEVKKEPVKEEKEKVEVEKKVEEEKPAKKESASTKSKEKESSKAVKVSFTLPAEYKEFLDLASAFQYKGNTSAYITALIKKDIKANSKLYNQIKELDLFKN